MKRNIFILFFVILATTLCGQEAVTGVTYNNITNSANRTVDNIRYLNETATLASVETANNIYTPAQQATNVYFRRNYYTSSPNNSTVFYQYEDFGSRTDVYSIGDNTPTLGEVMLSGDLSQGIRNPFANGTNYTDSNIERIDFFFAGGYTVQAGDSVVFFDLENYGNFGDGFRIAAFDAVNGSNTPTSYINTGFLVVPDSFGNPVDTPNGQNATYVRSTTTYGDNLYDSPTKDTNQTVVQIDTHEGALDTSDLYLVGVTVDFSLLGLAPGDVIYGYSLMAGDVSPTSATSLVNWNNSSVYHTNTNSSTWGNMDFMGDGGRVWHQHPVPEPSTYGMIFLGVSLGLVLLRKRFASDRKNT